MGIDNPAVASLINEYAATRDFLHGSCFYEGLCEPLEDTRKRIRETNRYIDTAVELAKQS